jgi:hypothetical protein
MSDQLLIRRTGDMAILATGTTKKRPKALF